MRLACRDRARPCPDGAKRQPGFSIPALAARDPGYTVRASRLLSSLGTDLFLNGNPTLIHRRVRHNEEIAMVEAAGLECDRRDAGIDGPTKIRPVSRIDVFVWHQA